KSAMQGDLTAQKHLAKLYCKGIGVKDDYLKAMELLQKAADTGDKDAQYDLGDLYATIKDYGMACEWLKKAADSNHAAAQNYIGYLYMNGYGVKKDYSEAMEWFKKALERDNKHAQGNIGLMYYEGYGVEKDTTFGLKLIREVPDDSYFKKFLKTRVP